MTTMNNTKDKWDSGDPYDYFMGRWSKLMALEFLNWLDVPDFSSWLDIGCGTGALSEMISQHCKPSKLTCIDPSEQYLTQAKERLNGKGEIIFGSATDIPKDDSSVDVVVSGLALNFFPKFDSALFEMERISKPDGLIAAYVWDYSDRMDLLRYFWDAVILIDPNSSNLDEGIRFPICKIDSLTNAFQQASLQDIVATKLDITMHFKNFELLESFFRETGTSPQLFDIALQRSSSRVKNEDL